MNAKYEASQKNSKIEDQQANEEGRFRQRYGGRQQGMYGEFSGIS